MSGLNASGVRWTRRAASFLVAGEITSLPSGESRAKGFVVMAEGCSLPTTVVVPETNAAPEVRVRPEHVRPPADKLFRGMARGSGIAVLTLMTLIGLFLALRAQSALSADGFKFVTTQAWDP